MNQNATDPFADLSSQESQQEEIDKRAKQQYQEEANDMRWLMTKKPGRRIMFKRLDRAGVWRSSFNTNAMTMAFMEGTRNAGLEDVNLIMQSCPELWMQMIKENTE